MSKPKGEPALYVEHRKQALALRLPGLMPDAVHAIVMDWPVSSGKTSGMTTVVAVADGTASIYLSTGDSFTGGSDIVPAIKAAALHAVRLATRDHGDARSAPETSPPSSPNAVFFYFVYEAGILLTRANEATLRDGSNRMKGLGVAMQKIITEYRLLHQPPRKK